MQNKKIVGYDISSRHKHSTNLMVPVLYMVALSELKLNENSKCDEVVMYKICCILESFPISDGIRKYVLFAFVTDFLCNKPWAIKRNTFSFIL